jgi:hypothetical protein
MDKKKSADPSTKECTNCGTSGAKLRSCGKCKAARTARDSIGGMATRDLVALQRRDDPTLRRPMFQWLQISKLKKIAKRARSVWSLCLTRLSVPFPANIVSTKNAWKHYGSSAHFRRVPCAAQASLMGLKIYSKKHAVYMSLISER